MAVYTRESAKKDAREALKLGNYSIVIDTGKDFKKARTKVLSNQAFINNTTMNNPTHTAIIKNSKNILWLTDEEVRKDYPNVTTIKDLEAIFYKMINNKIELRKRGLDREGVYWRAYGHNFYKIQFYQKVRDEWDKVRLVEISKKVVGGDGDNPLVVADKTIKITAKSLLAEQKSGKRLRLLGLVKHGLPVEDAYLTEWDGLPIEESRR